MILLFSVVIFVVTNFVIIDSSFSSPLTPRVEITVSVDDFNKDDIRAIECLGENIPGKFQITDESRALLGECIRIVSVNYFK